MNTLRLSAAKSALCASALAVLAFGLPLESGATPNFIRNDAGFTANTLAANDDGSTGLVGIGFEICFFGQHFSDLFVNNNGNVTFSHALSTFTPNLGLLAEPIIAPFFADVDTRAAESAEVTYGFEAAGAPGNTTGHDAFGVDWLNVGYFAAQGRHLDSFQLVLIRREDLAPGDFDIEFNYGAMTWDSGQASGSNIEGNCTGQANCVSALVGYGNGAGTSFAYPGSLVHSAFLAGGANDLNNSQITIQCRNCEVINRVPEPGTLALLGLALGGLAMGRRRWA